MSGSHVVIFQETTYNQSDDAITTISRVIFRGSEAECTAYINAQRELPPDEMQYGDGWVRVIDAVEWQNRLDIATDYGDCDEWE